MQGRKSESGSIIMAAVVVTIMLISMCVAYVTVTTANIKESTGMDEIARAEYVAEAGIQDALVLVNDGEDISSGLTGEFDSGNYEIEVTEFGADGIDNDGDGNTDDAEEQNYMSLVSTGTFNDAAMTVEVVIGIVDQPGPFTHAAFGDGDITGSGQMEIDSYDSDVGPYAAPGNANGNIGSNQDINLGGRATVMGNANPGPSGSFTASGPHVTVSGTTDSNPEERELEIPVYSPTIASAGSLSASVNLSTGSYRYDDINLASTRTVQVTGDVVLYIDGKIKTSGRSKIEIAPGAKLTIYQGDADIQMSGQGIVNVNGKPTDLIIYSASTSSVKLSGQADLYGAVYAPGADIQYTGQADIFGALVGNEIRTSGQAVLHYDEALSRLASNTVQLYAITAWRLKFD